MLDTTGWNYIDGYRKRIGLITPAPGSSTESEFNRYKPKGIAVLTTRIPLFGISCEGINEMISHIDQAAKMLADSSVVDLILFSCTAGSFINGIAYDNNLIEHLEALTDTPVTTTSKCVIEALNELNVKSLDLVTPYPDAINELEKHFLESSGFTVNNIDGARLKLSQNTPKIPSSIMAEYAYKAHSPKSEVMFISCTGLHVDEIINPLEKELGIPVITSNQCGLWGALRKMGIKDKIPELGKLFTL